MASSGGAAAALRHSFVTPVGTDRDRRPKTLTRTPSLPSQFGDPKPQKHSKKRPSGLFESSSESGGESSAEEPSAAATKHVSFNSRSSTRRPHEDRPPARHPSLSANNSSSQERRGLFETEDDAGDSVESLRERVKLRQQKKESEIQSLRTQLADALAQVQAERREKDEFAIRMNECQRIIEKRNKQLIKASEKLARLAEQSDAQINELQTKVQELTVEVTRVRAEEEAARERQRVQYEEKLAKHRSQFQAQMEKLTQTSADKLTAKEEAEAVLRKRITQLETDVVTAASRIAESAEYQTLLKRCEDAEAISRGLRFQLEKAQNEKKQLKKQVLTSQTSGQAATASAFMPPTDFFADIAGTGTGSPASSVASGDLANFDFFSSHPSPPQSPSAAAKPPPVSTSSTSSRKPSLKVTTEPPEPPSDKAEKSSKASSRDSRDSVYGTSTDGNDTDLPAPSPPPTQPEKTETKTRPGSGTINFFEKMTFKFKRSASSPRATAKSVDDQEPAKFSSLFGSSTPAAAASTPIDIPPASGRRNVLPNRPKMYVAKSPSDYEESSDSIFGSDSESNDSSSESDDDGGDDEPPPPPPQSKSRTPPGSSSIDANIQPPLPPLFGDPSDADSSSLSSDDEDDVGPHRRSSGLRRVVLPVPSPPKSDDKPADRVSVSSDSLSDRSESNSDTSDDEREQISHTPPKTEQDAKPTRKTSGATSDSSGGDERSRRERRASNDGSSSARPVADSSSRREKRERSRSTEGGDANAAATAKVNRMNEYMEARAKKRQEKLSKKEARESAEHKKREEYEKEWERMAQEERERRRKQQQARRTGKRRPSSMKTVRVSQMRQQMSKHHHSSRDQPGVSEDARAREDDSDDGNDPPPPGRRRSDVRSSDSDVSDNDQDDSPPAATFASSTPLPPEPSAADTELYIRQQARLRERHELEMKKRQDADEADQVRGQIHRRIEMWAFGKELLHLILTLDQISSNDALKQCQLMVVQSPDPETLRKAYRNIIRVIHPDKLRNASIAEQLEAKELFTVLNQAFEKFKAQG